MLSFSSFDSFPDRRQVVYTVETLEFQKFSRNSEINSNFEILLATINMFAAILDLQCNVQIQTPVKIGLGYLLRNT